MKKLMILLCTAVIPLSSGALAAAETSPTPRVPEPPLLNRPSAGAQWVITSKPERKESAIEKKQKPGGKKRPEASVSQTTTTKVIKGENSVFEETVNKNGVRLGIWYVAGSWMSSVNGQKWIGIPPRPQTFDTPDYSSEDFAGFGWVTQKNFSGMRDFDGSHCMVFDGRVVTLSPAEIESIKSNLSRDFTGASVSDGEAAQNSATKPVSNGKRFNIEDYKFDATAYIDKETRLPVALVYETPTGKVTRTYRFEKHATGAQNPEGRNAQATGDSNGGSNR